MPRTSIDTNILIYAIDIGEGAKHERAADLVGRLASSDTVLTQQVLGELLNVLHKRTQGTQAPARTAVEQFVTLFQILPTPLASLLPALDRAGQFRLQFWDSLIITICLANGVSHLLSEDLQDGQKIDGLTVVNPFNPDNHALLERLLEGSKP